MGSKTVGKRAWLSKKRSFASIVVTVFAITMFSIYKMPIDRFTDIETFEVPVDNDGNKTSEEIRLKEATSTWVATSEVMSHMDETSMRCKGVDMGCFVLYQVTPQEGQMGEAASVDECLQKCQNSPFNFAGLASTGMCHCIERLDVSASNTVCDIACSADQSRNCQATNSIRVYLKPFYCHLGFSAIDLQEISIGCVDREVALSGARKTLSMVDLSPQQCILNCEKRNFTLAVPVLQLNACICTDSFILFQSATTMRDKLFQCTAEKNDGKKGIVSVPVYRTLAKDDSCGPKKFLARGRRAINLLVSFPGSGNTWMRHLTESATGIYTGSQYTDTKLMMGGFIGESLVGMSNTRTVAKKNHLKKLQVSPLDKSAILLVRNPYHATIADFARYQTKNHTALLDQNIYKSKDFDKYIEQRLPNWIGITETVFKFIPSRSILIVYYEDLLEDPVEQMRRIVSFLPQEGIVRGGETLERRLMCMQMQLTGNFRRAPKHLQFDPFDDKKRKLFDSSIRTYSDIMARYKKSPPPASYLNS